jgi:uncharacterized coiled-coil DUF342 family protein
VSRSTLQGAPEERGPATDEVAELKAKITKLKRQALNFKNKLGEAVAARDVTLAELQTLKEVGHSLDFLPCKTNGRNGCYAW